MLDNPLPVHPLQKRIFICGAHERADYQLTGISHFVCIANPKANVAVPCWFKGTHLQLWFSDVLSEGDAALFKTRAACKEDVQQVVEFSRVALHDPDSKILVSCDFGASRSPALAYVLIADHLGPGREEEAFQMTLRIRETAIPNRMIVRLGDVVLKRGGELLRPLQKFNAELSKELFLSA